MTSPNHRRGPQPPASSRRARRSRQPRVSARGSASHKVLEQVSLRMQAKRGDRADRAVGLRQVDVPADPEPHARARARRRARPARCMLDGDDIYGAGQRRHRDPPADRHGVPEAQPVPGHDASPRTSSRASRCRASGRASNDDAGRAVPRPRAGLWNEVKNRLDQPGGALSGGQQQRLCIARALAVATRGAADGRAVLGPRPHLHPPDRGDDRSSCASRSPIVIVTHNMQQAQRVSSDMRVLPGRRGRARPDRRDGHDRPDVHAAGRPAHARLRPRTVRLTTRAASRRARVVCIAAAALAAGVLALASTTAARASGPAITGAGSTWAAIALDQWEVDAARMGLSINYQAVGSTAGRQFYIIGQVDFAASEIPFLPVRGRAAQGRAQVVSVPARRRRRHGHHVQRQGRRRAPGATTCACLRRRSPASSPARSPTGTTPPSRPTTRACGFPTST